MIVMIMKVVYVFCKTMYLLNFICFDIYLYMYIYMYYVHFSENK